MADDFRSRFRTRQYQSISPLRARQSPGRMLPSPLRRATTTDMRSIFVGNLPANINEERLFRMFDIYGVIQHIEIVRKPSANRKLVIIADDCRCLFLTLLVTGVNAFAFIEYMIPEGAAAAIQASPRIYGNARLRVERKESTDPSTRINTFVASGGSPRSALVGEPHDQMAMLYQRGLYAGLSQAAQVQAQAISPPMWSGYPYYQPYDPSQYGPFASVSAVPSDNSTAAGLQPHSNGYAPQVIGQGQYPQSTAQCVQYQQQPIRPSYQWPPANSPDKDTHVSPSMGT